MYPNINNECRFDGTLQDDPNLSYIPYGNGKQLAKCKFTISVLKNLSKQQREQAKAKGEFTSDFINCELIGPKAEVVAQNFRKGSPIKVTAVFRTFSYNDKTTGNKVYSYSFDVTDFGFATRDFSNQNQGNTYSGGNYNNAPFDSDFTPVDSGDMPF